MHNYYYELKITISDFKDEIANFLMERFFNGIEERDNSLILRGEDDFSNLIDELKIYVSSLEEIFNKKIDLKIDIEKKSNKDWIKAYQESINPVEIDKFYIRPSWYPKKDDKIDIIIDPALAFGSGHHETTRSCVKAISKYVKEKNTVLDVGCGSGILGIVAAKLGAVVDACDTDPLAVESAKENFKLNSVKYNQIWEGSAYLAKKQYDVVIANIVADVLVFIANDLKKVSKDILILSGIIDKYKDRVKEKYIDVFDIVDEIYENEWVTLTLKRK